MSGKEIENYIYSEETERLIRATQPSKLDAELSMVVRRYLQEEIHQKANEKLFGGEDDYKAILQKLIIDPEEFSEDLDIWHRLVSEEQNDSKVVILGEEFVLNTEFHRIGKYVLESLLRNQNNKLILVVSKGNEAEIKDRIPYDDYDNVAVVTNFKGALEAAENRFQVEDGRMVALVHPSEESKVKGASGLTTISFDPKEIANKNLVKETFFFDILTAAFLLARNKSEIPETFLGSGLMGKDDDVIRVNLSKIRDTITKISSYIAFNVGKKLGGRTKEELDSAFQKSGKKVIIELFDIKQTFCWIVPGKFLMGSPKNEADEKKTNDETQHKVILTKGFWLADTVCTKALWEVVMGDIPISHGSRQHPVERISWDMAQEFLARLNDAHDNLQLRLPTEAEWEYACRAGTSTPFSFGDTINPEQANYAGCYPYGNGEEGIYRQKTVAVKTLPANPWGLYEMHGNVWEWCQDWYSDFTWGVDTMDPKGADDGTGRVLRGGSWSTGAVVLRSAYRVCCEPGIRVLSAGFRLARDK